MLLTIVLLAIAPIHFKYGSVQQKSSRFAWYAEYFGVLAVAILFYVAWGFGIPATHPLNLGVARVIFQVIFIVCSICQGVVMVLCFCFLSQKVRHACCCGQIRPSYPITNTSNAGTTDANAYAMAGGGDGLLFENPISDEKNFAEPPDLENIKFEFSGSATADKECVKEDFSKVLEDSDDQVSTKL